MRCKPGDLAIVVGSDFEENVGAIVRVIEPAVPYFGDSGFYWTCVSDGRALSFSYENEEFRGGVDCEIDIDDRDLLPIRPDELPDTEEETKELETL